MKVFFTGAVLLYSLAMHAQFVQDSVIVDKQYLEDQFYLGITYNFLLSKPENVGQQSLSYGLRAGFIKDIPLNPERNIGLGVGIGYGVYSYYSNLVATEASGAATYSVVETDNNFERNKIETHLIEIPIEFRWRKSTPTEYKFWRIYTGFNLSYVLGARSKYVRNVDDRSVKTSFNNTDVSKFQYGLTFNIGWNTFNIHAYYALNNLFERGALLDGERIDMKPLRLGFIFYIL
ncbi:PorT family protein [Aggregatimonas sangjinii]|uniref:PorT family protein n=1 Tax=Aggregatimonas sangjinii TaxID=2583587 RepID=A0A5B7SRF3_9FLAO|nr:porin family protein [Aggregatimonas sangjinii]QCX01265.1 PorT family protein [Aggregatimonas sangjinii]